MTYIRKGEFLETNRQQNWQRQFSPVGSEMAYVEERIILYDVVLIGGCSSAG